MQKSLVKKFLVTLGLALAIVSPAQAVCLRQQEVVSAESKDGKNLTFKLRDGRVLNNRLKGTCSDLRFGGFVWVLHGDNSICENTQTLRTINSGQVCILGKFEDAPPKMPPVKAP